MEFHLTKRNAEPKGQWVIPAPEGITICYEEPLHGQIFPNLMDALEQTGWPFRFHGYFYRMRTNSHTLEEVVPASEYYKISYRAMSQKYQGILATSTSIESVVSQLKDAYLQRRKQMPLTGQPKLVFTTELYHLRTDFASLLFLIRSFLDQFAALIQFLSGPSSRQFRSFADVMTKAASPMPPLEFDRPFCEFLSANSEWFWRMRDVRDYIAHHGFVDLRLVQTNEAELRIYIYNRIDLLSEARAYVDGFDRLLSFLDAHFAERITGAIKSEQQLDTNSSL